MQNKNKLKFAQLTGSTSTTAVGVAALSGSAPAAHGAIDGIVDADQRIGGEIVDGLIGARGPREWFQ